MYQRKVEIFKYRGVDIDIDMIRADVSQVLYSRPIQLIDVKYTFIPYSPLNDPSLLVTVIYEDKSECK